MLNRRDFLKLGGALSFTFILQTGLAGKWVGAPTQAEAKGMAYRGTANGQIYKSADGKNWEKVVDFGPDYSVYRVGKDLYGQIYARLRYAGQSFELKLMQDGKSWFLG